MVYVGHDIVNLTVEVYQNKHLSTRWMNKVFCKSEQEVIINSQNPHETCWVMWACKESFFKAYSKAKQEIKNFIRIELYLEGTLNNLNSQWSVMINQKKTNCQLTAGVIKDIAWSVCLIPSVKEEILPLPNYFMHIQGGNLVTKSEKSLKTRELYHLSQSHIGINKHTDYSFSYDDNYLSYIMLL